MGKRNRKKRKVFQIWWIAILTLLVFCMLLWESGPIRKNPTVQSIKLLGGLSATTAPKKKDGSKRREKDPEIRVLLKTTGFARLFHKDITLTSSQKYTVTIDGEETGYDGGKKIAFHSSDKKWKGKKIAINPSSGERLQILSIKRQGRCPKYRSRIELAWKKGGFLVYNTLSLEEYLYAVVPSELSTSSEMEALKAQAVCARSYAYNQMKSHRYDKYHGDVDDSEAFQVYNNVPEDRRSRKAVKSTRGMVLTKGGKVVQTYYYSTSWGYTADGRDVWNTDSDIPYLQGKFQITEESQRDTGKKEEDLSGEDAFLSFLRRPGCETYDSGASWYRWNVSVGQGSLSARIDNLLSACYSQNPNLVLTQTKSGRYVKKPLKSMGTVRKIRAEHRTGSGLVTEIVIVGSENVVKVVTQHNIRKVLAPLYERITYNDGKSHRFMSMLPSAAFCVSTLTEGEEVSFLFIGGGLGHGAGLSQCGAARMAKMGKSYQEILLHFFIGTELMNMADLKVGYRSVTNS